MSGTTTALAVPVSSSRVMKQNPFAVPGRWRTMTRPAIFTQLPSRACLQIDGAQHAVARQLVAQVFHDVRADGEAAVV